MVIEDKSHVVNIDNGCRRSSVDGGGGEGYSDTSDRLSDDERRTSSSVESGPDILGVSEKERRYSASECSLEVDLENWVAEMKVHLDIVKRDCRICHLSLDMTNQESGTPIELGCSCKDDLAAAHKQCAEAWFKIKGNKTCEICGSVARNVAGAAEVEMVEQRNEGNHAALAASTRAMPPAAETRNFRQGNRILNFLLTCMLFAFVISWLFHFNVPT